MAPFRTHDSLAGYNFNAGRRIRLERRKVGHSEGSPTFVECRGSLGTTGGLSLTYGAKLTEEYRALLRVIIIIGRGLIMMGCSGTSGQCRSTPTSAPPKVSARAPAHRSYHFRGVKLKSCIKKIHHNLYISKQANVRIKHADTEGSSHKKFGTDARVQ